MVVGQRRLQTLPPHLLLPIQLIAFEDALPGAGADQVLVLALGVAAADTAKNLPVSTPTHN